MSLFEQVYDCTDRWERGPLAPPDEVPGLVCPECGALLLSSQLVRQEGLFHDVVGCEECSEWQAVEALGAPPESCPNCGEAVDEGAMLLVSDDGVPLACDCCASDGLAVYHCGTAEEACGAVVKARRPDTGVIGGGDAADVASAGMACPAPLVAVAPGGDTGDGEAAG